MAINEKLRQFVKDDFVCELLDGVGIRNPSQIAEASNDDLKRAGLTVEEIAELRAHPKLQIMQVAAEARKLAERKGA